MRDFLHGRRVVIVVGWFRLGGAERQAILLARGLRERGMHVEVWGFQVGRGVEECEAAGVAWKYAPWPLGRSRTSLLWGLWRFALRLRRARPEIVLPFTTVASGITGLVWRLSGARASFWNQRDEGRDITGKRLQKWAVESVPLVIANSVHATKMMREAFGLRPETAIAIRNGVVAPRAVQSREQWRRKLGLSSTQRVAVMVAHLHSHKDHATLLLSWRQVLDEWPSENEAPVLLLAGREENTFEALQAQALELSLGQSVRFLGDVSDIGGLLRASDVCAFSSRREGVPNGVLEAMACGLPVVATGSPGLLEALDGTPSLLAPEDDAASFAEHLRTYLRDGELCRQHGERNREIIERVWSPERMVDGFALLFAHALAPERFPLPLCDEGKYLDECLSGERSV
jgi:glycosyltransferase involved in cell wall biosynthesis